MKKFILMLAVAASAMTASAQNENVGGTDKFFDNWYIGINAGASTKTTHQALLNNLNPDVSIRLGKWLTPCFGLAAEGTVMTSNKVFGTEMTTKTFIRTLNANLLTTWNFMNMFGGYTGKPRTFEIIGLAGFGYGTNYGNPKFQVDDAVSGFQLMTNKLALDFALNLGSDRQWQLFLEPSLTYSIAGAQNGKKDYQGNAVEWNINSSHLALNLGVNYYFKTSNGTHHFKNIEPCDYSEIDILNGTINDLRNKSAEDANKINKLQEEIIRLKKALQDCEDQPKATNTNLNITLPPVFYKCDKWNITPDQAQNVAVAAQVLKNHPELKLIIKGYASPEGPVARNMKLSEKRSVAVKNMLVNQYGIDASRITTETSGVTDKLFKIYAQNRVAMMFAE